MLLALLLNFIYILSKIHKIKEENLEKTFGEKNWKTLKRKRFQYIHLTVYPEYRNTNF